MGRLLRRAYYQFLYANNFLYIEEYPIIAVAIILLALIRPAILGILVTLFCATALLVMLSPRSPLCVMARMSEGAVTALREDPATARPLTSDSFQARNGELLDEWGRRVYLRGVNVGGKLPLGHTTASSRLPQEGSFVGTLFELNTIDAHLHRLVSSGFTLLRLNVTWEALEPEAEGIYDFAYIDYLTAVVRACDRHGLRVIVDSHQDAWSRWTGGDGAPKWTMECLGIDTSALPHTRSAMLHCEDTGHLTWFTNYTLFGAGTMFALFFGGNRFAPKTMVKGQRVQEWLQSAYIKAWCTVASALAKERNVLGFEPMNEPSPGWIGLPDLRRRPLPGLMGWDLTPWESIRLANGDSLDVASFPIVNTYRRTGRANPTNRSAWKPTYIDVWRENSVWDAEEGLLRPDHFRLPPGETFETHFLTPFNRRFALAISSYRTVHPPWWIVCYPKPQDIPTAVAAPHWYDNITLVMNRHIPFLALTEDQALVYPCHAASAHQRALKHLTATNGPFFLGEVGIPWLGTVTRTAEALESTMTAVDACFISALTLWNYNSHHTQEGGDAWNLEDFSIWDPALSFRMPTAVRPFVMVLAGRPVSMQWQPLKRGKPFTLVFDSTPDTRSNVSLIFVPEMHFRAGLCLWASDGGELRHNWKQQTVEYRHSREAGAAERKVVRISGSVASQPPKK